MLEKIDLRRSPVNGRSKSLPNSQVAGIFGQHPLGMELKPDHKARFRVVVSLDEPVFGKGHGLEAGSQPPYALMVVAVHLDIPPLVPILQGRSRDDLERMPVGVIAVLVNVGRCDFFSFWTSP